MVIAKFLSALTVFAAVLGVNSFNFYLLYIYGNPSLSYIFLNVLTLFLIGAAFIAVGVFISSLTESPIISCILTLVCFMLLMVLTNLASLTQMDWVVAAAEKIAFINLFSSFSSSVFHIVDVIYLLSISAVFVFMSIRAVERRRWA